MRRGIHSNIAILVAAATTTVLAPFLFYACTIPVSPTADYMIFTGPFAPLHAGVGAFQFAPLALVVLFALAVLLGAALSLMRARHVVFYLLAGAGVSIAASFFAPLLVREVMEVVMVELMTLHEPAVTAATAAAGLLDGAVFWLIVRHFD